MNILKALKTVNFRDEQHKINYILTIISNNINDVYTRIQEKEECKKRLDNVVISTSKPDDEYLNKTDLSKNKVAKELEDLF